MMRADAAYAYPIWAVALAMAVGAVVASLLLHLIVGRLVDVEVRQRHNVLTGSIISIVGVTYAVLLAFVAMLAWESYDAAKAATGTEAARLADVARTAAGLAEPGRSALRAEVTAYATAVRESEWPAQAEGRVSLDAEPPLVRANAAVAALRPSDIGQGNMQAALIAALTQLRDARDKRLASAETAIPSIVWVVVIAGGALTLVFASLLGASHLRLHLALASLLALSGILVLVMIVALSHPFRGDFRVTPEPFDKVLLDVGADR